MKSVSETILSIYEPLFCRSGIDFNYLGVFSPIPKFSNDALMSLCTLAQSVFSNEPTVLHLSGDTALVGDIHGNIKDLLRIFALVGKPTNTQYLFLGDYVDIGDFSIEVATLLFALKCQFPTKIFMIRGNHEVDTINAQYGFKEQIEKEYTKELWIEFNKAFDYLPIAAIISKTTFAIHGGLSPLVKYVNELEGIEKPITSLNMDSIVIDILWSDPMPEITGYMHSQRGRGSLFGNDALHTFLANNSFTRIVRGHQCIMKGVAINSDQTIITVFSSCNYMGTSGNSAGIVALTAKGEVCPFCFPPLSNLIRNDTFFRQYNTSVDFKSGSGKSPTIDQKKFFFTHLSSPKTIIIPQFGNPAHTVLGFSSCGQRQLKLN